MLGDGAAVGRREEVNCTLTVPFALLNLQVEVPTAIVPPEGFETKKKQLLSQAGAITQKTITAKRPSRKAFLVLPEVYFWRMAAPHWGAL